MPTPEFEGNKTGDDGWEFDGWNPAVSGTVTQNAIYTAKWKQTKFTVTYDLNGGSIDGQTANKVYPGIAEGASTPKPSDPVKFGFTFTGWGSDWASTVTRDVTYTAQWEPVQYVFEIKAASTEHKYDGSYYGAAGLENVEEIPNRNGEQGVKVQVGEETFYITGYSAVVSYTHANADGKVKDAGEYTLSPQAGDHAVIYDSEGNVFDNGQKPVINLVNGKLAIGKRQVTLTSATDTKVYDGSALTNDTVTVGGDSFAEGRGATYSDGLPDRRGQLENAFTYA